MSQIKESIHSSCFPSSVERLCHGTNNNSSRILHHDDFMHYISTAQEGMNIIFDKKTSTSPYTHHILLSLPSFLFFMVHQEICEQQRRDRSSQRSEKEKKSSMMTVNDPNHVLFCCYSLWHFIDHFGSISGHSSTITAIKLVFF